MEKRKLLEAQPYTMLANERYQLYENYMLDETEDIPDQQQIEDAVSTDDKGLLDQLFIRTLGDRLCFGEYLARIYCRQNGIRTGITEDELIAGIQKEFRANNMYKLKLETLTFPDGMNREEKEKWLFTSYEYTSIERSSKSIMGSIDFLSNTRVLDKKDLRERLAKPANKVTREELFLFAFGMKLGPDEVTAFIQKYLGEPGIRWKDYREFIYFWCLRNAFEGVKGSFSGIEGVYNAFRYYYKMPKSGGTGAQSQSATYYYQQRAAASGRTDMEFRAYLGILKEKQPENGYSQTRCNILNKNLKKLHFLISDAQSKTMKEKKDEYEKKSQVIEERGFSWQNYNAQKEKAHLKQQMENLDVAEFERDLWECVNPYACYPLDRETIQKIGFCPIWKHGLTGKKINLHTRDILREDILISNFLYYAYKKEFGKEEDDSEFDEYLSLEPYVEDDFWDSESGSRDLEANAFWDEDFNEMADPLEIKEAFESVIELDLASCDMHAGLYLPNPFEMFLLLCLLTPAPYSVFMNAWSMAAER